MTTKHGWKDSPRMHPRTHYCHNLTGEDNADAHFKRPVIESEVIVAVKRGKLDFGPWE